MKGFMHFGARSRATPSLFLALFARILGAPAVRSVLSSEEQEGSGQELVIGMGPLQTLTFRERPDGGSVAHEELSYAPAERSGNDLGNESTRDTGGDVAEGEGEAGGGTGARPVNNGAHVSLYVADLPASFRRAEALGCVFVNHRFSRRAYTLDEAVDQCMFRVLDVVDPENAAAGPILRLEHEVRSVTKKDGTKYKSAPFSNIADLGLVPPLMEIGA